MCIINVCPTECMELSDEERLEKVRQYSELRKELQEIDASSDCLGMELMREINRINNVRQQP